MIRQSPQNNAGFKKWNFKNNLRGLLGEYGFSLREIVGILDPQAASGRKSPTAAAEKKALKAREMKVYKKPLTGEVVETKGGNHKLLKAWKSQFEDEVETWLVI